MKRLTLFAATLAAFVPGTLFAQQTMQTYGAPQQGVETPNRYTSPSQSQQVLTAQPPAAPAAAGAAAPAAPSGPVNPYQQIIDARTAATAPPGAEGAEGADGAPQIFVSDRVAGISEAQPTFAIEDYYRGVTPHIVDSLPHISRYQQRAESGSRANELTWVGFQPFDGATRVFIQTGRDADYSINNSPDGLTMTITLRNTTISVRNFTRDIDASYFGRAVQHVQARRSGRDTAVTITLARSSAYTTETSSDGDSYLFIDFAEE
jgi:hypothetical protein